MRVETSFAGTGRAYGTNGLWEGAFEAGNPTDSKNGLQRILYTRLSSTGSEDLDYTNRPEAWLQEVFSYFGTKYHKLNPICTEFSLKSDL